MRTYKRNRHDMIEERKVLFITSLAEFAERYGYYVVQSLLIFFLIEKFNISQESSTSLVGTTLAMIYISAIVGGYIAEKFLGYYRSGMLGSILMLVGFFILASSISKNSLYLGLSFISISTGLIKSNMASFIGRFYDRSGFDDSKRDFGFNIFYMGINLGGFCALVLASYLQKTYGYASAFYSSMFVNFLMLVLLILGYKVVHKHMMKTKITLKNIFKVFLILMVYMGLLFFIYSKPYLANLAIFVAAMLAIAIMVIAAKHSLRKTLVAGVFFLLSIVFWAIFFQIYISLLIFSSSAVDNSLLNPSQIISIENFFVIVLAYWVGKFWIYRYSKGHQVNDIDKFKYAFISISIGFVAILLSILITSNGHKVGISGFIIGYLFIGLSELFLSAIGLSMITKIAPKGFVALYMGIWLITLGIGGKLGGILAGYFYIPKDNLAMAKASMVNGLSVFILIAVITSLVIFVIRKYMNKYSD